MAFGLPSIDAAIAALEKLQPAIARETRLAAQDIYENHSGSVIVTGMGKCSHVGKKIAATFQSTGTPASFLHPAEALHGDMGMIATNDIILALSNSGETDEVLGVVDYAKCRHHEIISITSNPTSPIAQAANISFVMPRTDEGCPIGRAPMASTIMMMAVGDALAAELMNLRGFTEQDFLKLHHGGYLGRAIRAAG